MPTFLKRADDTYQEVFGDVTPWEKLRDECLMAAREFEKKASRETSPHLKEQYERHASYRNHD